MTTWLSHHLHFNMEVEILTKENFLFQEGTENIWITFSTSRNIYCVIKRRILSHEIMIYIGIKMIYIRYSFQSRNILQDSVGQIDEKHCKILQYIECFDFF